MDVTGSYAKLAKISIAIAWAILGLSFAALIICHNLGISGVVKSSASSLFAALFFPMMFTVQYFYDAVETEARKHHVVPDDEVRKRIESLAMHLGAGVQIGSYQSEEVNAFAISSAFGEKALIAFSTSLLEIANDSQLIAIAAHEIAHIKNGDSRNKTFILAFSHAVRFYPHILSELVKEFWRKNAKWIVGLFVLSVILTSGFGGDIEALLSAYKPLLSLLIWPAGVILVSFVLNNLLNQAFAAYSRGREFAADFDGARMTSHQDMIAALSLFDDDDHGKKSIGVFDTHPPVADRKKRLMNGQRSLAGAR
jgi:Zn-dependent protease with chaperone function